MSILITGAGGFIGRNLAVRLNELCMSFDTFTRDDNPMILAQKIREASVIVHLAGVNRPVNKADFLEVNTGLTEEICRIIAQDGDSKTIINASSTQAAFDNDYGSSKRHAEQLLENLSESGATNVVNYRLPNVFGKWSKPNYNSAVATFCSNVRNGQEITINDPSVKLTLLYIDDLIEEFVRVIRDVQKGVKAEAQSLSTYDITVGELASIINSFKESEESLVIGKVGTGLTRALYSTYLSFTQPQQFKYSLKKHTDERGDFVEFLKTKDAGQFSYFTARPGVTRGGHYHHSKNEKFLVLAGTARFKFRNILTDEVHAIETSGDDAVVIETVPGWSHDITNIGESNLIVMLWANEIFDAEKPDTFASEV